MAEQPKSPLSPDENSGVIRDDLCFCCGQDNEKGLKLKFTYDGEGTATASLVIPTWFSGWRSMTHGGLLSTLLDESMAHACINVAGHAITAELIVRYHSPVETGTAITITGKVESVRSRLIATTGEIRDSGGRRIASGRARFMRMDSPID